MIRTALYARVSSEKQAQSNTIESQICSLKKQIFDDGYLLLKELEFVDNGYSGSNIIRPALEKIRDTAARGELDKIYIHSPDRLSRKYAHQILLIEEFQKNGVEIVFSNHTVGDSAESHLLLQMQGMIAEYEREKIMERSRRGMIHAAKKGSVNVLGKAPYGYRYIDKYVGSGEARYEVIEEEAMIAQQIFSWVGYDRLSIGAVCRKLSEMRVPSPTKLPYWGKSSICAILKNPTYKGLAAFGKQKIGNKIIKIRPSKNSCEQPKNLYSKFTNPKENWIYIPVPALIDEILFESVQEQLEENRKISRSRVKEVKYLLQGLVLCGQCHYACYARPLSENEIKKRGDRAKNYVYYRCSGTDASRFGGNKICDNKPVRLDALDMAIWEEVKVLLKNPDRLLKEYQRRISELEKSPYAQESILLEQQELKLQRGIARLIDSYAQEYINKEEFEPRVQAMKQRLKIITEQKNKITDQTKLKNELMLIVTNLENFSLSVESKLENIDWTTKRDIIRTLVKRIEINREDVNVVFRINNLPGDRSSCGDQKYLQHRPARNSLLSNKFIPAQAPGACQRK